MLGWNLKPLTPYSRTSRWTSLTAARPMCGSTLPNAIRRVRVVDRGLGDLVVRHRLDAHRRRAVDGEHDRHHLPRPVVLGHLRRRRAMDVGGAEVVVGGLLQFRRQPAAARDPRHLGVGVDVDGDERVDVDRWHAVEDCTRRHPPSAAGLCISQGGHLAGSPGGLVGGVAADRRRDRAGFVNANAGGGSILTVPLLVLAGVEGNSANGSNRVGVLTSNVAAATAFRRLGVRGLSRAWPILVPIVVGSLDRLVRHHPVHRRRLRARVRARDAADRVPLGQEAEGHRSTPTRGRCR